jgi:hypothetical protein
MLSLHHIDNQTTKLHGLSQRRLLSRLLLEPSTKWFFPTSRCVFLLMLVEDIARIHRFCLLNDPFKHAHDFSVSLTGWTFQTGSTNNSLRAPKTK